MGTLQFYTKTSTSLLSVRQYLSTKSVKMSKIAKKQFKTAQNKAKKIMKKQSKPRALRKLQKSKPKRYMNPYLCFLQEQRKLFKGGKLLSDWRLAHKGLGAKWRALGTGKARYQRQGKVPAFAMFVKNCPERKIVLPAWSSSHKGLGGKWKAMDKATKAKYVASSKNMKGSYDNQMKAFRAKRKELLRSIRAAKMAKKARRVLKKKAKKSSKKLKSAKKVKKVSPKKGKKKVKSAKEAKVAQKKGKKGVARKINARALPQ